MAERRLSAAFRAHIKQRKDPLTYDRRAYMNADTARAAIPDALTLYRKTCHKIRRRNVCQMPRVFSHQHAAQ